MKNKSWGGGSQTDATKTSRGIIQVRNTDAARLSIRLIVTSHLQVKTRVHPVPPLIRESLI